MSIVAQDSSVCNSPEAKAEFLAVQTRLPWALYPNRHLRPQCPLLETLRLCVSVAAFEVCMKVGLKVYLFTKVERVKFKLRMLLVWPAVQVMI